MGGFYNAAGVRSVVDNQGTHPLDVVSYGGKFGITASPASGAGVQILAAPPSGYLWRLHAWGVQDGVAAGGAAEIADTTSVFDAQTVAAVAGIVALGKPLNGQLCASAVSVVNQLGATLTFFLRYDQVWFPNIS